MVHVPVSTERLWDFFGTTFLNLGMKLRYQYHVRNGYIAFFKYIVQLHYIKVQGPVESPPGAHT